MENGIPHESKERYDQWLSDNFKDVYKLRLEKLRIRADRRDDLLKILLSMKEAHDEGHPYVTMSDVVKKSGIKQYTTVWRLVNRLVEEGLVDKVPLDRPKQARKKQTGKGPENGFALNRDFALEAAFKALYMRSIDWKLSPPTWLGNLRRMAKIITKQMTLSFNMVRLSIYVAELSSCKEI